MRLIVNVQRLGSYLVLAIVITIFAACGTNSTTTTGGNTTTSVGASTTATATTIPSAGSTTTATPSVTPTKTSNPGMANVNGCPNSTVVNAVPARANVTVTPKDINSTINAHVGDIIEIRLPFEQKWDGPMDSVSGLEIQKPAGYPWQQNCIWQFAAKAAGTVQLPFEGRALCEKGKMCAMYIINQTFNIDVKS